MITFVLTHLFYNSLPRFIVLSFIHPRDQRVNREGYVASCDCMILVWSVEFSILQSSALLFKERKKETNKFLAFKAAR